MTPSPTTSGAQTTSRASARAAPPPPPPPGVPWISTIGVGAAVLLAGTPVSAVVQGPAWVGHAIAIVAAVVGVGLLLHRAGTAAVTAAQLFAALVVLVVLFADEGVLGLLPGPAALREFGALMAGAAAQIDVGTAPVLSTPEILFLVTTAFGLLAVAVHLAAVHVGAPAAAGIPLLAVFAVPAALADDLLPWWSMAAAAAGFGILLVARDGARRQLPGGAAVVAGAVVLALAVGAATGFVGTAGRFDTGSGAGGNGGSIGLSPFTALRGQLDQSAPTELLRVRGLPQPTYLRALTLRDYVPEAGWQAGRPEPGTPLPGSTGGEVASEGDIEIQVENVAFRDYWLPLYGSPVAVSDLSGGQWSYDERSGTAYTLRPREEDGWSQRAELTAPTLPQLREGVGDLSAAGQEYLNLTGVDPRVAEIAEEVVAGRESPFDRALALQDYFTGSGSRFSYSLATAPGGGDDALVEFLTVGLTGYCEQYASAMAVMLRTVGVPARVAVGFTGGTVTGDYRSISTADAHAWVEAWFPGVGWTTFDPTPLTDGRAITPSYVLEAQAEAAGVGGPVPADEPGVEERPVPEPASTPDAPALDDPQAAAPAATGAGGPLLWPFLLALPVIAVALTPAALRAWARRRRMASVTAGGPDAAGAAWAELLAESADRGAPARSSDTVRAAARRLVREHRLDADSQQALRQVVGAVESSWYGDEGQQQESVLVEPVQTVRNGIVAGTALSVRERLLPRSVLSRRRTLAETPPIDDPARESQTAGNSGPNLSA